MKQLTEPRGLIGDLNLSFHNGTLVEAQALQAGCHLMGLLVGTVVPYPADPARREEVHIDRHVGEVGLDIVPRGLGLLAVSPGVATGKGLYTIAHHLIAAADNLGSVLRLFTVHAVLSIRR